MLKKIHAYLTSRGMSVMVVGFAIAAIGLLAYIYNLNNLHRVEIAAIAHTVTFTGFGIYVVGRIYVVIKRRQDKAAGQRQTIAEDNES